MFLGKFIYKLCAILFFIIFKLFFRLKIEGKKNIPTEGPIILVANHSSLLDPFIITCTTKRIIHWLVASWVFKIWPFPFLAKRIPFLKVEPGKANNKASIKEALNLLKQGRIIGIFPEGKLSKDEQLNPFLLGAAYLGIKSASLIVPLYIEGANQFFHHPFKSLKFPKIRLIIGEGFYLKEVNKDNQEDHLKICTAYIRDKIAQLKDKEVSKNCLKLYRRPLITEDYKDAEKYRHADGVLLRNIIFGIFLSIFNRCNLFNNRCNQKAR